MTAISITIHQIPAAVRPRSLVTSFRIKGIGRLHITNQRTLPGSKFWNCCAELTPTAWQSAHEFVRALKTGQSVHVYHRTVVAWSGRTYTPKEPCIQVSMTNNELSKHNPRAAELRVLRPSAPPGLTKKAHPVRENVVFESCAAPVITPEAAEATFNNIGRLLTLDRVYLESSRLLSEYMAESVLAEPRLNLNDLLHACTGPLPHLSVSEFAF